LVDQAATTLRRLDPDSVHREAEGAGPVAELLGSIGDDLRALSETITYFYFSHAELRVS
jgi:hypothetical protein